MLTEKDPHIPSSERSTQNGDDIKNIDNNDGSDRYAVELKESIDTFDPEALAFNPNSEEIRKVRWKIDKRLIPLLTVMYLCSFLDRANIGMLRCLSLTFCNCVLLLLFVTLGFLFFSV